MLALFFRLIMLIKRMYFKMSLSMTVNSKIEKGVTVRTADVEKQQCSIILLIMVDSRKFLPVTPLREKHYQKSM